MQCQAPAMPMRFRQTIDKQIHFNILILGKLDSNGAQVYLISDQDMKIISRSIILNISCFCDARSRIQRTPRNCEDYYPRRFETALLNELSVQHAPYQLSPFQTHVEICCAKEVFRAQQKISRNWHAGSERAKPEVGMPAKHKGSAFVSKGARQTLTSQSSSMGSSSRLSLPTACRCWGRSWPQTRPRGRASPAAEARRS